MTKPIPHSESAGGEAMLAVIATAIIAVVAVEAAFIVYASWWLVPCLLLGVLAATAAVIYALLRTIENDTPVPVAPPAKPRTQPEPQPARKPIRGTALAGR